MTKTKKTILLLTIGSLGVVFGDLGTSPLYAISALFTKSGFNLKISASNIYGIISLIIWSITIIISIKFVGFIMKADNQGEGGIMALVSKIKESSSKSKYVSLFIIIGLIGAVLFYGDSTITPAISVLSAVQGLSVIAPHLQSLIIPITILIIIILFIIQKFGTTSISHYFSPIMLIWFFAIGLAGLIQIIAHPNILISLSPLTAINFFIDHPAIAFIGMGAVVLAITGAEALYADLGHFGRQPISRAWLYCVFPALTLCYMGEGALVLAHPHSANNPLILMYPNLLRIPFLILSTLATIIASQAVISSAFSLTKQAINLNYLPKMTIKHTSLIESGQIFIPLINIILLLIVISLIIIFKSSDNLANAYGIAVSGTLLTDTILFLFVYRKLMKKSIIKTCLIIILFLPLDLLFVSSNIFKIVKGGWIPLLIGLIVFIIMTTWIRGERITNTTRRSLKLPIKDFAATISNTKIKFTSLPEDGIYIGEHEDLTPLALSETFKEEHELQENILIVNIKETNDAHVPKNQGCEFVELKDTKRLQVVNLSFGYHDSVDIPNALHYAAKRFKSLHYDEETAVYFVSIIKLVNKPSRKFGLWTKHLYLFMHRNSISPVDYYKLPINKTIEITTPIDI